MGDTAGITARIRVLVADDHAVVREGLASLIGRQDEMVVVAEARDGREAVDAWLEHRPDVSLLDLRMPRLDGVGALREIRASDPEARVIFLTTYDTDEEIYQAIRAGARAFLLKDALPQDLLECIRKVRAGETTLPASLVSKLAGHLSGAALTPREREVLALLAKGESNKEIGVEINITETTVKSHVKSIFAKLGVVSRTEAVAEGLRRGLVRSL